MSKKIVKGARVTGDVRTDLGEKIATRYTNGETVREIAADLGRSYGFVHGILREQGVALRSRGGNTRGANAGKK